MNVGKRTETEDFPGVSELALSLTPENIMAMDEEFYRKSVQPKYFYLSPDELWKWKVDALNYMGNNYEEGFRTYILEACVNENEKIKDMALTVAGELSLKAD
jgi:epoxyqueuosine reductase